MKADIQALSKLGIPKSVVDEMEKDGILEIILTELPGGTLGQYRRYWKTIEINRSIPIEIALQEIRKRAEINLSPNELYLWILFHEMKHHKASKEGRRASEAECNAFASERLSELRGYTLKINVDLDALILQGVRAALGRN
jgi:hypothetical protein